MATNAAPSTSGPHQFVFELFCIDPADNDIKSVSALLKALAYSNRLWDGGDPKEVGGKNVYALKETQRGLTLILKSVDTSKMLTNYTEAAYIVHVEGDDLVEIEAFRFRLLKHLRNVLQFNHIRLLSDDVSNYIANQLYPEISRVESLLRRYLTKFFIQRVGLNWWESTATKAMVEKVKMRGERKDDVGELIDADVSFVDFDDLGELIYKQSSGFNQPEKVLAKLLSIDNIPDLRSFQMELQGNYTKYFKEFFQDKHFEYRWKELFRLRNKVAHQGIFYHWELERGLHLTSTLTEIITEAESKINEIVFSVEEKEAIRKASIEAAATDSEAEPDEATTEFDHPGNYYRAGLQGLKVVGRIALPEKERFITEEQMLAELESALNAKYNNFVGLKWFVTTHLATKKYAISASYALVNILADKNKIELYDLKTHDGYTIKALRFPAETEEN